MEVVESLDLLDDSYNILFFKMILQLNDAIFLTRFTELDIFRKCRNMHILLAVGSVIGIKGLDLGGSDVVEEAFLDYHRAVAGGAYVVVVIDNDPFILGNVACCVVA